MTWEEFEASIEEIKAHLAANPPRDVILDRMGYRDYNHYRESSLWKKIRRRILKRAQQRCVRCGDRATEVHHLSYGEAVLMGNDDSQLAAICRHCHDAVERDSDGNWRTEVEKMMVLRDPAARPAREERERRWNEELSKDAHHAAAENYECAWCRGNARGPGSIERVLRLPTGEQIERFVLCFGCYEVVTKDGRGRTRDEKERRALLRSEAPLKYTIPEVGPHGHANQPQNWQRMNMRQKEAWESDRCYRAALLENPKLADSNPPEYRRLKQQYDRHALHGVPKRCSRPRPMRGPDPVA